MGLGLDNPVHLAIVLAVVLVLFGAKRVPEIGHSAAEERVRDPVKRHTTVTQAS